MALQEEMQVIVGDLEAASSRRTQGFVKVSVTARD